MRRISLLAVNSGGWVPLTIDSTISGDKKASGSRLLI